MYKLTVRVKGMMCARCEAHVNDAVRESFKVESVTSDHSAGVTVITAETVPDEDKLRAVIEGEDYEYLGMTAEEV